MRPNAKDRDRAGNQHLARNDALPLLYAGDIGHRLYLVLAGPALWREERVQPVSVGAGISVRHDLTALLVVGCVGNPPPDLVRWKRNLKLREKLRNIQCQRRCRKFFIRHGKALLQGAEVVAWTKLFWGNAKYAFCAFQMFA